MPREYRDAIKENVEIENTRYSTGGGFDSFLPGTHTIKNPTSSNVVLGRQVLTISPANDIQLALDTLDKALGGILNLKAGTYFPTTNIIIPSNTTLQGEGTGNTIIDFQGGAYNISAASTESNLLTVGLTKDSTAITSAALFTSGLAGDYAYVGEGNFYLVDTFTDTSNMILNRTFPGLTDTGYTGFFYDPLIQNIVLKDFSVKNTTVGAVSTGCLNFTGINRITIENVKVTDYSGTGAIAGGIRLVNCSFVLLNNCESSYNTGRGFYVDFCGNIRVLNCTATQNTSIGFRFASDLITPCQIYGCNAYSNTGDGFDITQQTTLVACCDSRENGGDGFDFDAVIAGGGRSSAIVACSAIRNGLYGFEIGGVQEYGNIATGNTSGGFNLTSAPLTLVNGNNNNQQTFGAQLIRITGPGAAFAITGFDTTPSNISTVAREMAIYNTTAFDMTIANENVNSDAANRIITLTGADVVLTGTSAARFIYSSVDSRWILLGTQG